MRQTSFVSFLTLWEKKSDLYRSEFILSSGAKSMWRLHMDLPGQVKAEEMHGIQGMINTMQ